MTTNSDIKRHVDWSIIGVIGSIVTILIQTAGLVWWAAGIDQRMANVEQKLGSFESAAATLARLDERTQAIQTDTTRIYSRVDSLEQRGR